MVIVNGRAMTAAAAAHAGDLIWITPMICAHCGEPFDAVSAAARYCCAACKQSAYRDRMKERNAQQRFVTARGGR